MIDPKNTFLIEDRSLLDRLYSFYNKLKPEYACIDVETDSKYEVLANLFGVGICFNADVAFYIPWRNPDKSLFWDSITTAEITEWLQLVINNTKVIGHNFIYDALVLEKNLGINAVDNIYSDTLLQKHTLNEEPPFGLKDNAVKELGDWADNAQDDLKTAVIQAGGRWTKDEKDMYLSPTAILGKYCCWDVLLTFRLFEIYQGRLESEELMDLFYNDEIMDLYREVTIPMKRMGIRVDMDHFNSLSSAIDSDITSLESDIQSELESKVYPFVRSILNKEVPVKSSGSFPKAIADVLGIPMPVTKAGKVTMAAKAIDLQKASYPAGEEFYNWIGSDKELPTSIADDKVAIAQKHMYLSKKVNENKKYIFNLQSNDHLGHLIFNVLYVPRDPKRKTPTGKDKVDVTLIEENARNYPVLAKIAELKKLEKLKGTYIEGIISRQVGGRIYASMLQFGTTSGRYASKNPNLQNLPRVPEKDESSFSLVEKYTAAIRKGFISDEGCSLVDADYASLEPRAFSHVSGDKGLQELWAKGEDFYSRIAIDVLALPNISAHPKDPNYLKKVDPAYRQNSKGFSLSIPYGAEAPQISKSQSISIPQAQDLIDDYLGAYPGLKAYMRGQDFLAKTKGYVKTQFGRIRHLPKAKTLYAIYGNDLLDYRWAKKRGLLDLRRQFKKQLNNSKNFPIQGLAAHIINRGMIKIAQTFKAKGLKAYICLTVHDQVIINCPNENIDEVKHIVQDCLENTVKLTIPLIAEPEVALNMAESH